jgi:autotransporter-associated beta strand protein
MRNCITLFYRVSSIIVLLTMGVCLSSQSAWADSFDWQSVSGQNWNTPVESQFGGTCWDFSACANIEAKYKLTRNDPSYNDDVSEQEVDWEQYMGSTGGGWGPSVLTYFTTHGVVSAAECPTQGTDIGSAPYWPLAAGWQNRVFKSTSNLNDFTNDINTMKADIKMYGPMEVGIWAGWDLYGSVADVEANYRTPAPWGFDHEVSLVGYCDDPAVPSGGYWIIKNSWGYSDTTITDYGNNGYDLIPYGNIEVHNDISSINGPVYYTGAMATATWNGGAGTWISGGTNWSSSYAWQNQETAATFAGTGGAVTISGPVIAHSMTINSSGYTFSGGSLTVTAGGIQANQSATINSDVYIGGPQAWTVAPGQTLTVNGPLHTIISDLTFNGAGNTIVAGAIDGGGVLNIYGGATPGGLIQAGSGTVTLSGTSPNFAGNITVNAGAGPLNILPAGGASATYSGAFFGGGTINVSTAGTVSVGGGTSNFTGTVNVQSGTLQFVPAAGIVSTFSGTINSGGTIVQNGPGTTVLPSVNNITGGTTISNGALQANFGVGIAATSFLTLDGGVLQSDGSNPVSFTRGLGTSGAAFEWTGNGGGFSAGAAPMTVNIGGQATPITLSWGSAPADVGTKLVGTLKFGSTSAVAATTFQNSIALGSVDGTIQVDHNPNSTSDIAEITGNISGSAGIIKTGVGALKLSGANVYGGTTTINGGVLLAGVGGATGIPSNSFININGGMLQVSDVATFTRSLGTSGAAFQWGLNGGGFSADANPLSVNVGGQATPITLAWGSTSADVGTKIVGPLTLNAWTAGNALTFQNGIDLAGGARSLVLGGNSVYLNGPIVDSVGGASLTKTGPGVFCIGGSSPNTYSGSTTISGGDVYLNKSSISGYAIPGDMVLTGTAQVWVNIQSDNQFAPTSRWTFNGTGASQEVKLLGHNVTVAGISAPSEQGIIENTWSESGYGAATLTINTAAGSSFSYNGTLRDTYYGSSGALSLVKTGGGTQTLWLGNISYSGGTTINGGTLVLQDVTNTNFSSCPVADNATLELDPVYSSFSFNGAIGGSGSLTVINGSNQLTLGGSNGNTYTGSTTFSTGTVSMQKSSGYAVPGNFTINNNGTYVMVQSANPQFPASAVVTFSGSSHFEVFGNTVTVGGISGPGIIEDTENQSSTIGTLVVNTAAGSSSSYSGYLRDNGGGSGTLALVKNGAGSLTLTGAYVGQYTGGLTVNAGMLSYSGGTAPNCNYTVTGGTLNVGGSHSMKILQLTGGSLTGGTITGSSAYDLEAGTVSIALGGTVGFNKSTPGTVTFTKAPPNGPYSISDGVLVLGTMSKTMSGGSLTMTGGTLSGSGTLTAATGYNYNIQAGTIGMILGGASTIGLTKSGTGTAILLATQKYGGATTINGGILQLGSGTTTGAAGTATITINSGGTLQLGDGGTAGSVSGTVTVNSGGTFDFNRSDAVTITSKIGGSGTLAKDGGGTLTMSGSNTFAGDLVVNSGLLSYGGNTGSFPSGNFFVNGGTLDFGSLTKMMGAAGVLTLAGGTISGSGTLTGTSAYQLQAGTVNIALGSAVDVNMTGPGTVSFLKALPGGGTNYWISGGVLNLNAFSQTINGLQITGGTVTGSGTLTNNSNDYDIEGGVVDVVLAGAVNLQKSGPATALLTRANTFAGATTISGGALQADFGAALPASSFLTLDGGVLETLVGGTFSRSLGASGSSSFQFTGNGGGFSTIGAAYVVNIGGAAAPLMWGWDGTSQLAGTLKLCSPTCTNSVTFVNPIDLGGGAQTIEVDYNPNSTAAYAVLSGAISDSIGGASLTKTGDGTLYLQGATSNTYSGPTTIMGTVIAAKTGGAVAIPGDVTFSETGDGTNTILQLNGDNEIASSAALTFSTWVAYARLELNGHAQTVASISGNANATIEGLFDNTGLNSDSTLTVNNAADCVFSGVIRNSTQGSGTGKVNLVKGGGGDLILTGTNLYTGSTTVNGGMLQVTGSIQSSCGLSVVSPGTVYFNRSSGFQGVSGPITGSGTVQIYQGTHSLYAGTGGNTSFSGFSGTVNFTSGGVYLTSANALGSGPVVLSSGVVCDLKTSTTSTFSNAITLNGIGGTLDGYAKPAIYGDGSGGAYTLSGQITLAASSDIGNYYGNGMLTLSGYITGAGGLILGKAAPTLADEYGAITISGAASNDYGGTTTINRGTVYLQKSGGAIAIPSGSVTIAASATASTGNTYLILQGSNQIAPSATLSFSPAGTLSSIFELLGNQQTLAGISDQTGRGVIENAQQEAGVANNGTLTINNTTNCAYSGCIRNGDFAANGASTGLLALVKSGPGTLTLTGGSCSSYTGGLTVNAGTLDYSGAALLPGTPVNGATGPTSPATIAPCPYTINGGTLNIGTLSASIGAFQITGGTVSGSGALSSNAAYDVQAGTVNAVLGGSVGLNKTSGGVASINAPLYTGTTNVSAGTLNITAALPGGNYAISGGTLNIGGLSKLIGAFQITGGSVIGSGTLTSGTAYDIQAGTVGVTLGGSGRQGSVKLNKTGSGVAILTGANTYTGLTTVAGGALELGPAAQNCVFNLGGADIQSGAIVFDYTSGADPIATIQSLLKASCDGGHWDLGQFRDSTALATGLTLGCVDNTATDQVEVMATYPGDFNLDGVVDNKDRAIWFANAMTGTTWQQGDANYDGVVDGRDRDLLFASLGLPQLPMPSPTAPAAASVPEPGTLALLAAGLMSLIAFTWRKRP